MPPTNSSETSAVPLNTLYIGGTALVGWAHQDQAAAEANTHPKRALFWSPRLGKTLGTIKVIQAWGVTRGIVVAPLLVCPMWAEELRKADLPVQEAFKGPVRASGEAIAGWGDSAIIINYDRLKTLLPLLLKYAPEFLVLDESHWIKSPDRTGRAQAARRLAWATPRIRLLTGTPAPNHFGELWGQMTCVDPEAWGKAYGRFAVKYLVRDTMYPSRITGYNAANLEELNQLVASGADIRRREDVFGPDDFQYLTRRVSLPDRARVLYRKLAKQFVLEYSKDGIELSAPHVLSRLTRLQQLTSGYLPAGTGVSVPVLQEIHTAKIDAVIADLDEITAAGEKVVIFHRFTHEGTMLERAIQRAYPNAWAGRIGGGVPVDTRTRLVDAFNSDPGSRILLVQTQSGGIGISLAEATHALFVSCDFSWDHLKQALDRIYNRGTEGKPLRRCITTYIVPGTVDEHIQSILDKKSDNHFRITHADLISLAFGTSGVKI